MCELTLDPNTAHSELSLSDNNRKVTCVGEDLKYPHHPDRFTYWEQVMCKESLIGRSYWEVEWCGERVKIAVTYRGIKRQGEGDDSDFGWNTESWCLVCYGDDNSYRVYHNETFTDLPVSNSDSNRVGVYLDCPAGTLSFYKVSSDTLTHLHTFCSTFTEPLFAGFHCLRGSSVSLCQREEEQEG